jgi:hypothetical protein
MAPILLTTCTQYVEDPCISDDCGEPKGQCRNCGCKWYEHKIENLPVEEQESAKSLQNEWGLKQ